MLNVIYVDRSIAVGKQCFFMVIKINFRIFAPRPPISANKGDVASNGLPVRWTPRGYKETILRYNILG